MRGDFKSIEECRDPKDNKYLELAVSGNADYIITGDKDLLVLNPFRAISIITVDQFLLLI
ncbi:putative toxin-antitoxin system toxin component, PIN family [Planktothrix sp. PCC 11201]|uniref:putative toxin-antitoxin system toxin component, PIN family n=1 Tax=Planktothrix sp. PCC 11201 TaxID=1729650 RepID=UPI0009A5F8C8